MRVRAKFRLAGAKGESKEQLHQVRLYLERKLRSMDDRQNLFVFVFLLSQSQCLTIFSSVPFTFMAISGFSMTPDSLGCVANFAEIHLAKNEIAITVPSNFLTPRGMGAFSCVAGDRENFVYAFTKSRRPGVYVLSERWHHQHHKIFLPHSAIYISLTMTMC